MLYNLPRDVIQNLFINKVSVASMKSCLQHTVTQSFVCAVQFSVCVCVLCLSGWLFWETNKLSELGAQFTQPSQSRDNKKKTNQHKKVEGDRIVCLEFEDLSFQNFLIWIQHPLHQEIQEIFRKLTFENTTVMDATTETVYEMLETDVSIICGSQTDVRESTDSVMLDGPEMLFQKRPSITDSTASTEPKLTKNKKRCCSLQ